MAENMLGPYGAWATGLAGDEPCRCHFGGMSSKMKGTKEADSVLVAVYGKAGAADTYAG